MAEAMVRRAAALAEGFGHGVRGWVGVSFGETIGSADPSLQRWALKQRRGLKTEHPDI